MLALKRGDIPLVNSNPDPKAEYLKENIVTEANVTYLSTADNNVAMPVSVRYKPKAGKSGEEMKQQFLNEVDVLHNFANWMVLLCNERACLSMLHTIRNADPHLKKILPRDSVLNKDRMDVDCVLHLSKENVLSHLESIDHVVHSIVPDSFKISETNKPGMYPHPVAVCVGEHGKILVLDYAPKKNSLRLLEVRLHVPTDVKILGEYLGATSMVYSSGIAYFRQPSGIQTVPIAAKPKLHVRGLKKADLVSQLAERGLPNQGTVQVLQDRLEDFLNHLEKTYKEKNIDLSKVYLSQRIKKPSCIAKASECILVCSSDVDLAIYIITLEMNGVVVRGNVNLFCNYPNGCKKVIFMCVNRNILCVT